MGVFIIILFSVSYKNRTMLRTMDITKDIKVMNCFAQLKISLWRLNADKTSNPILKICSSM